MVLDLDSIRFDWKQFDSDNFWEATSRGHGLASATAPAPRAGVATGRDDEALQELIDVRKREVPEVKGCVPNNLGMAVKQVWVDFLEIVWCCYRVKMLENVINMF